MREPSRVQLEDDRPPRVDAQLANRPPTPGPPLAQSPAGVMSRRAPPPASAREYDAAVEHAPEIPLAVVLIRRGRSITQRVQAHDEVVTPIGGGVLDEGRNVNLVPPTLHQHTNTAARLRNHQAGGAPLETVNMLTERRSMRGRPDVQRLGWGYGESPRQARRSEHQAVAPRTPAQFGFPEHFRVGETVIGVLVGNVRSAPAFLMCVTALHPIQELRPASWDPRPWQGSRSTDQDNSGSHPPR